MNLGDSIAALASPSGRSLRAILRVSGPGVDDLLREILESPPVRRGAGPARLRLGPGLTLPLVILYYPAPSSYTGETTAELLIPGNPVLVDRVIALLTSRAGVRPAEPGEFSARAYLNGRLTLAQAEGVAAIVAADSAEQLDAARGLLTGATGDTYRSWAGEITTLLALVEAGIDFTDQEDVQAIAPPALQHRLAGVRASLDSHLGAAAGRSLAGTLPTVALLGPPNAGKSTLFNALLARRRAVTSPTAGTTRDALAETLDFAGDLPGASPVSLTDLAGLDDAAAGDIAEQAQARARAIAAAADLILHCDPAGRFEPGPLAFLPPGRSVLRVRTKADLPGHTASPPGDEPIAVCALDGWNLPLLRRAIADRTTSARAPGVAGLLPRHHAALARLRDHLITAEDLARADARKLSSPELVAAALRDALDGLGELVGRISPDEVLGKIFATFCVGK